ncbi:MAG: hypothetical protein KF805_15410 [Phycisphaeraceae bacterium]|nr:hypothetical protein [Phycisphaeraceae bacterium]
MKWFPLTWGHLAGGVLILAGTAKLVGFPDFAASVRTWTMLPAWAQTVVVVVIPPLELGMGTALLIQPRSVALLAGFTAVMLAFTAAYSIQLFGFAKPDCGCLGLLAAYSKSLSESPFIIGRNLALAAIGIVGCVRLTKAAP